MCRIDAPPCACRHRYIPPCYGLLYDWLLPAEVFNERILQRTYYALKWQAHGTLYGITNADVERGLTAGKRLVLNVSRSMIAAVLETYAQARGIEVYCLNITASEAVLRARLVGRGRWGNGPMFKSIFVLLCIPPLTIVLLVWLVCLFRRRAHNYFQYFGLGDAPPLPPELQASDAARAATKHLRFVHISDTHMCHERLGELPAGDVLVHNIAHLSTA